MIASEILYELAGEQGWDSASQLRLLIDFVDDKGLVSDLEIWLRKRREIEENLDDLGVAV